MYGCKRYGGLNLWGSAAARAAGLSAVRRQIKAKRPGSIRAQSKLPLQLQGDILLASRHHRAQRYKRSCLKAFQTSLRLLYKLLRELMYGFRAKGGIVLEGALCAPSEDAEKEYVT